METAKQARRGEVQRRTAETDIRLELDLDGQGRAHVATGIGFFDHLLTALARHGLFDLTVHCTGDLHVDGHHTVEDTGLCLGQALRQALGDKAGIRRFGHAYVPMDEALVLAAVDISGRPYLAYDLAPTGKVGQFDAELGEEFFRAVVNTAGITLHLRQLAGRNSHHILEAGFKAFARALRDAVSLDPRVVGVPSTKGVIE
ncbi:MAG: imidazoleglycerol-phosphate dehydratase [Firmicutes bacterium ZCTH02-B6]|nr:MAG: imidazoleglycerol-phosphate dehydratase [Firmicutes bacterium ZCTH02-B6]